LLSLRYDYDIIFVAMMLIRLSCVKSGETHSLRVVSTKILICTVVFAFTVPFDYKGHHEKFMKSFGRFTI